MDSEMERNTVTRTFSIGAISNRAKAVASDDFFAARRHSSAGIRALLWANNSKLFGCSEGWASQTSLESTYPNILTPDSIPQFTIPSLSLQSSLRSGGDEESEEGYGSSELPVSAASSLSSSGLSLCERKAERSVSDPLNKRRFQLPRDRSIPFTHTGDHQCLDAASRAALSLPHLPKVTTPYGFVTLSQSPQMASEEALLCQAGLRRCWDQETVSSYSKAPLTRTKDVSTIPSHLLACRQRLSTDSEQRLKRDSQTVCASPASRSMTPANTDGKFKKRFQEIIRKHFSTRSR